MGRVSIMILADLPRSRWKNGQGARATIIEGDGWSLSHAWIEADVPFSDFRGMDRTCALLAGGGMSLGVRRPASALTYPRRERRRPSGASGARGRGCPTGPATW